MKSIQVNTQLCRLAFSLNCGMLCLLFSGCVSVPMYQEYAGPKELPEEKQLNYEKKEVTVFGVEVLEERSAYTVKQLKFEPHVNVFGKEHEVTITLYQHGGNKPRPLILCLPIMDGKNKVAKILAGYFVSRGYHAAIVHKQRDLYDVLEPSDFYTKINAGLAQIVYNHRIALDWFEGQPFIDSERIGAAGVSMGSIKALLVSAYDSRIRATFSVLAGGDLPYIMRVSDDSGVTRRREAVMRATGKTLDELETALRENITHDPLKLAPYIDARQVMLFLATDDTTVPSTKGLELWRAMGGPATTFMLGTHVSSAIYLLYILEKADVFFRDKLELPNRLRRNPVTQMIERHSI